MSGATEGLRELVELLASASPRPWRVEDGRIVTHTFGGTTEDNDALIVAAVNALPGLLDVRDALEDLLAACIEEYGEPDEGGADEAVGWNGDGSQMKFTYGHLQRARKALAALSANEGNRK